MKKKICLMFLALIFSVFNTSSSKATTLVEKAISFPSNILRASKVNITVTNKGKLMVALKKAFYGVGKEMNTNLLYDSNGRLKQMICEKKKSKKMFVDGKKSIKIGDFSYYASVNNTERKIYLKVYNRNGKRVSNYSFPLKKLQLKYKSVRVEELSRVSPNKYRILYGNVDSNGTGNHGGSAILNISNGRVTKEKIFSFVPYCSSGNEVCANTSSSIIIKKINGKNKQVILSKPSETNGLNFEAFSFRDGEILYVNNEGAYFSKRGSNKFTKLFSLAKSKYSNEYVMCAGFKNQREIYIGFGADENVEPKRIIKYALI